MINQTKPSFFLLLQIAITILILSPHTFAEETEIKNPLKAGLVRIGSSYKNQCIHKKEKCNQLIKRSGLGFIFKINLQKPHYFVATTSHLTQGSNLFITSLDLKTPYTPKVYKFGNKNHYLRSINNDDDLEILEINDPSLPIYFEHNPSHQGLKIFQKSPQHTLSTASNSICTKVDQNISLQHFEKATTLTSGLIGLNLDETYAQMIPWLNLALKEKDDKGNILEWKPPFDTVQKSILNTQSVFYIFDLNKNNPTKDNTVFSTRLGNFLLDFSRNFTDGMHQIDSSSGFDRSPEFSWNLNEMFLNHFIFRGQSGTPYFYQLNDYTLCFNGLIKGFHRYFRKAYTTDIDGSDLITKTVEKLKLISHLKSKTNDTSAQLTLTEVFGISQWFMKDEETYRKFKLPFIDQEISELASWYGPSGGGDLSDGGGSDTSDGGEGENTTTNYPELKATRPISEILSVSNNPGVNIGNEILLGIDLYTNTKNRHLYANMSSLKFLNSRFKQIKFDKLTMKNFDNKGFLFNRILERLSNINEYINQLKKYQIVILDKIASRKKAESFGLYGLYTLIIENTQGLTSKEKAESTLLSNFYLTIAESIDQLKSKVINLLSAKKEFFTPYCKIKVEKDTIQLKVYKGFGITATPEGDGVVDSTANNLYNNFLSITLNSHFQVTKVQSDDGIYTSINPTSRSQGLDLRPKFFIKIDDQKTYENILIVDVKGLLFLDLSRTRIHLTANDDQINTYKTIKNRLPLLAEEPFNETIDQQNELVQYSPEASVLSRVAHITYKPIGSFKEYMIPCYPSLLSK